VASGFLCPRCAAPLPLGVAQCARCGLPLTVPYFPAHRSESGNKVVIIVVIIVLLVILIPIILGAVLYFMVSGLVSSDGQPTAPVVSFGPTQAFPSNRFSVPVVTVDRSAALAGFRVRLTADFGPGLCIGSCTLADGLLDGNGALTLTFTDLDAAGTLTGGDSFSLEGTVPGTTYTLNLLWAASGNLIASRTINA